MISFFCLSAALISNAIAQILKPIFLYIRTKKVDIHQCIACGGFPSSHSSTVTALSTAVGLLEGFYSTYFAITCIFSFIVIYDAVNVRYYAGKNIQLTKQLVNDLADMIKLPLDDPIYHERMKDVLGHRLVEAVGGFVVGVVVPLVAAMVMGYL